ncbi:GerMN domain-containing protein [Brasilonema bromeliae]|uniref:Spore germination protein n=1 Tax=Brasilonema bromeliae SPC951 TaxID=385972 RepID=A0ABX1P4R9_9CYAN|nr:GerMN domain-containing protein [Brasilonema bromeliae]NMG19365.1 spore germination protein [Brasilonema bromeliae SPC951]
MKEQQGSNRFSPGIIAAITAAVIAVGGGIAFFASKPADNNNNSARIAPPNNPPVQIPVPAVSQPPVSTNQVGTEQKAEVFWLQNTGSGFKLVPQTVQVKALGKSPNEVLEGAFQQLLAGPTESSETTTIPQGTKLLGVKAASDGVHVNLSEEFESGGGSSSMMGRVGQVVYTATAVDKNAKVYIEVNGKPLETLGGEGLELEQPLTRESFDKNYSL